MAFRASESCMGGGTQVAFVAQGLGIRMAFLAQHRRGCYGLMIAGLRIEVADLGADHPVLDRVADFAADRLPLFRRHQRIPLGDPDLCIGSEFAGNAVWRRIDLSGGRPVLRRMAAGAVGIRPFTQVVGVRMRAALPGLLFRCRLFCRYRRNSRLAAGRRGGDCLATHQQECREEQDPMKRSNWSTTME